MTCHVVLCSSRERSLPLHSTLALFYNVVILNASWPKSTTSYGTILTG